MSLSRAATALLLVLVAATPTGAQLTRTDLDDVEIACVGGQQDYLVPHAARTFLHSLRFHEKRFDWTPTERISVLLLDFEDSGNASATSVPRNSRMVQVAPLSFAFETIAGNDRMNIIMKHELVHVVTMDQADLPPRSW